VTSWRRRGSSQRMSSWSDFASSTNKSRRLLCGGAAKGLLLHRLSRLERQAHGESAALVQARTGCLNLSSVLSDDPMADGQAQAGPLAGTAAREERLKDILKAFGRHP